ncbi:MAG: ftsZ [Ramlibacter sp.]|nr:ftsZ [Ramlibacter sp.]
MEVISNSRAATDTRHRIAHPNSHPRQIKVVGIGPGGSASTAKLLSRGLRNVQVVDAPAGSRTASSPEEMLETIRAQGVDLAQSLKGADMLFMVAHATDDVGIAPVIKHLGRQSNVLITGILIQNKQQSSEATLEILRGASDMLIVASDDSYVADMLEELGA